MINLAKPTWGRRLRLHARAALPELPTALAAAVSLGGGLVLRSAAESDRASVLVPAVLLCVVSAIAVLRFGVRYLDHRQDVFGTSYVRSLAAIASACAADAVGLELKTLRQFIEEIEIPLPRGTEIDVLTHDIAAYDSIPIVQRQLARNMRLGIKFRYFIPRSDAIEASLVRHLRAAAELIAREEGVTAVEAARVVCDSVEVYSFAEPALYYFALQYPGDGSQPRGLWYLSAPDQLSTPDGSTIVFVALKASERNKLAEVFAALRRTSERRRLLNAAE